MLSTQQVPRHILELTPEEQRDFLDSFDLVLADCDGVVWHVVTPIPHAGEGLNLLRKAGKRCGFVSNSSVRTDDDYIRKFKAIGLGQVEKADVMHPAKAIINYLQKHKPGERVFSICCREANEAMRAAGIDLETLESKEHLTVVDVVRIIKAEHKVGAVVLDINPNLNFVQLAKAHQYLKQEDCIFVAGGDDRQILMTADLSMSGFLEFQHYLTAYSDKLPVLMGKPSPLLGDVLKEVFNITKPERCLFIGDSLRQDIGFGKSCGFLTLLVLSGSTSKEDMLAAQGERVPDFQADSLADFIEFFDKLHKQN